MSTQPSIPSGGNDGDNYPREDQIFEPDRIAFEVIKLHDTNNDFDSSNIPTRTIATLDELDNELHSRSNQCKHIFYLIPQIFSWGQLQITQDAFQRLLASKNVFGPILNVVQKFGSKTRDGFRTRPTFHGYNYRKLRNSSRHDYGMDSVTYLGKLISTQNFRIFFSSWKRITVITAIRGL